MGIQEMIWDEEEREQKKAYNVSLRRHQGSLTNAEIDRIVGEMSMNEYMEGRDYDTLRYQLSHRNARRDTED